MPAFAIRSLKVFSALALILLLVFTINIGKHMQERNSEDLNRDNSHSSYQQHKHQEGVTHASTQQLKPQEGVTHASTQQLKPQEGVTHASTQQLKPQEGITHASTQQLKPQEGVTHSSTQQLKPQEGVTHSSTQQPKPQEGVTQKKIDSCTSRFLPFIKDIGNQGVCKSCKGTKRNFSSCKQYYAEGRMIRKKYVNISKLEISYDPYDVTFVTQLSPSKIDRLELVASFWKGAISAALYVDRKELNRTLLNLICKSPHLKTRTNIIYSLVIANGTFYPVNVMRNLALDSAKTPYVLLNDVDLIPKPNLDLELRDHLKANDINGSKVAWIVPAFETTAPLGTPFKMPDTKAKLVRYFNRGVVRSFLHRGFDMAYSPTLYDKWQHTNQSYEIQYKPHFEPYIVMRRKEIPPYDDRFLQRFRNKVQHIERIHYMGYTLKVLPQAYAVHLRHKRGGVEFSNAYKECANKVYDDFHKDMRSQYQKEYDTFWRLHGHKKSTNNHTSNEIDTSHYEEMDTSHDT